MDPKTSINTNRISILEENLLNNINNYFIALTVLLTLCILFFILDIVTSGNRNMATSPPEKYYQYV